MLSAKLVCSLLPVWCAPNGVGTLPGAGGDGPGHGGAPRPPSITAVAVAPGGEEVLTGASDGTLARWDLGATRLLPEEVGSVPGGVTAVAWGASGRAFVLDDGGRLSVLAADDTVRRLGRHGSGARGLAVGPEGERVVTGGDDGRLRLWCAEGEELDAEEAHAGPIVDVARVGERLWTVGWDRTLRGWRLRGGRIRPAAHEREGGPRELSAVGVAPDGERAVTACWDGSLRLWDVTERRPDARALPDRPHAEWVSCVRFAPDGGRAVAAAPAESALLVLDGEEPREPQVIEQAQAPLVVAVTPDGRQAIVGRFDGSLGRVELPAEEGR